jgi:hypothetical protein
VARASEPRLLVLHGLRLKGFALPEVVAELVGLDETAVAAELAALQESGLAQYRDGRLTGYALTPAGRQENEAQLAAELDASGFREDLTAGYKRFLELNTELLAICTRWQLREVDGASVVNDHTDRAYDESVVVDLGALHDRVTPICDDLAALLDRFASYGQRLGEAFDKVRGGDIDHFTKPIIPSYHTVWFELHEDLLATLGIERASEAHH